MRAIALAILAAIAIGNGDYLAAIHSDSGALFYFIFGTGLFTAALMAVIAGK